MRPLPGQLSLFEVDAGGLPESTVVGRAAESRDSRAAQVTDRRPRPASRAPGDALLSPEDVARRCALSRKAVYRAVARGELRAARILSRLRIDPSDVEAWLRANVVEPEVPELAPSGFDRRPRPGLRRLLPGT